jgi:aminomethyltransferase
MIRTTPFHPRTSALNESGLWEHWAAHLAAIRYTHSEKFEYTAIRNAAGLFDASPLYKYRITGPGATGYLAGVLARDPRPLAPGRAQYTLWCDDRGFVVEDGVLLRLAADEFLLTAAEPNLAWFAGHADDVRRRHPVTIEDVSEAWAVLAVQGPRSREILAPLVPGIEALPYFGLTRTPLAASDAIVTRTGYTGDLGYEIWIPAPDALALWDAVWAASRGRGVVPFGMAALYMTRIEAGLLLLDVDFRNSRFAWTDADRASPVELGYGRFFHDVATTDRAFVGRDAIRRELASGTSRFRTTGLVVDWRAWDEIHAAADLIAPKDHTPVHAEYYVYDDDLEQIGFATSLMYSPQLQRHIAIARVPMDRRPGDRVKLEWPVAHRYEYVDAIVSPLPHFDPPRRTA